MKSLVHIMKHMIVQGGAELTDTLQNTVLLYIGVQGGQACAPKMRRCCATLKPVQ